MSAAAVEPLQAVPDRVIDRHTNRNNLQPTKDQWANVFGPSAYDMKEDENRNRKRGRVHIPDIFLGPSQFLTDRVDGLIVDATQSPFTTVILPYMYMEYPDKKIEWNVWSFDQGLASRVPYESAARTLTQRKQSFSGYTVRQGLAITMEHNFMMSEEGMQNFKNQVLQVVQSIQNTNDLDVHMALINAPSYLRTVRERYYLDDYLGKALRDYIDTFGFVQKNMNALDILIEETKSMIKTWGGDEPDFMMCPSKLCFQITMDQAKTSYMTQGPDGQKVLKEGPTLDSYRGLSIVKSKAFSMDEGLMPRDLLRRRVRVAEHYVGSFSQNLTMEEAGHVTLYSEDSDDFPEISIQSLLANCGTPVADLNAFQPHPNLVIQPHGPGQNGQPHAYAGLQAGGPNPIRGILLIRPNIEHYMLGLIIGRGGIDNLGATLWGQTEMSVFDDGQHGVWGMTYKYHERAIVFNERNMHRMWDIAYDGYVGGKDTTVMHWTRDLDETKEKMQTMTREYNGKSIICVPLLEAISALPSPCILTDFLAQNNQQTTLATADLFLHDASRLKSDIMSKITGNRYEIEAVISHVYKTLEMHNNHSLIKDASSAAQQDESTQNLLMYAGTATWQTYTVGGQPQAPTHRYGNGHHGVDYTGVAAVRNGKSFASTTAPLIQNMPLKRP
tara:strand:+ start:335 stop:2341 length:2007 start_codon:yes stop_codon:yes gene_type:complete